jgi:uncharacterized membrane protein
MTAIAAPSQRQRPESFERRTTNDETPKDGLASALGWFSIGLGLAEVAAPSSVARLIGIGHRPRLLQAFGLREIASGIGILAGRHPASWLQARVGGDVLDLAALGSSLVSSRKRGRVALAAAAVAGVTLLDVLCARQLQTRSRPPRLRKAITINRSPEELYSFWHDFSNLPRFMKHLKSVRATGEKRSHWVARGPAGAAVEWDAEITEDRPNEQIAWRSLEGADVDNSGSVQFKRGPRGRGSVIRVEMEYRPPAGRLGSAIAWLFGQEPEQQVEDDLRHFKQLMETGEIPTIEGQPRGRC